MADIDSGNLIPPRNVPISEKEHWLTDVETHEALKMYRSSLLTDIEYSDDTAAVHPSTEGASVKYLDHVLGASPQHDTTGSASRALKDEKKRLLPITPAMWECYPSREKLLVRSIESHELQKRKLIDL